MLFIHTADLQIGRPFARVTDHTKRTSLQLARINVLDKIAGQVKEKEAKFVLVAGDFFDSPTVSRNTISSALSKVGKIPAPVYLIPGNHDHGGPGSLWEQAFIRDEMANLAPNLTVLLERKPFETEFATIFPCPLLSKQESESPTRWLLEYGDWLAEERKLPRILLAHGTVQGFAPKESSISNHLRLGENFDEGAFDYIALGDWHGTTQVDERTWYAGTPEIDRFKKGDDYAAGHILAVEALPGKVPKVEKIETTDLRWHDLSFSLNQDSDVSALEKQIANLVESRTNQDLLKLTLRGSLGLEASEQLGKLLDTYEARLLRIKRSFDLSIAPTGSEIAALAERAEDPVVSRVASKLIDRLESSDKEEREVAAIALRELYGQVVPESERGSHGQSGEAETMEFGELFDFDSAA